MRAEFAVGGKAAGAVPEQKQEITMAFTHRQTVLEHPAGARRGTKIRRHYSRAERIRDGKTESLPYAGQIVLIEKKGDKYTFRIEGGAALTGTETQELEQEFNKGSPFFLGSDGLLPKTAVRVGQSWTADPAPFAKELQRSGDVKVDGARAKASGKLLRAYKKDGRQYGLLELRVSVPVLSLGPGGTDLKAKDSKLTVRLLLDGCIDGSSVAYRLKGVVEMTIDAAMAQGGLEGLRLSVQADLLDMRQEAGKE
jgi:hypothetical protein